MTFGQLLRLLLEGAELSALLSVIVIAISTVCALPLALARMTRGPLAWIVAVYGWIFRGTPPLVVLYLVFFGAPVIGILIAPFPSAIVALSLVNLAYLIEVFRAGIGAVPHNQREAANALGLSGARTIRRIVLPQAVAIMMPAYVTQTTEVVKNTALASTIGVAELMGRTNSATALLNQPFKVFTIAAVIYIFMNSIVIAAGAVIRKRQWV